MVAFLLFQKVFRQPSSHPGGEEGWQRAMLYPGTVAGVQGSRWWCLGSHARLMRSSEEQDDSVVKGIVELLRGTSHDLFKLGHVTWGHLTTSSIRDMSPGVI